MNPTSLQFTSLSKKSDIVLAPEELLELYFYGIPIKVEDGTKLSYNAIETYIRAAQEEFEGYLNIKIFPQQIDESRDFFLQDYKDWGFTRVSYPVVCPLQLKGDLNGIEQITYPKQWLSSQENSDGLYYRNIYIVPGTYVNEQNVVVYAGVFPYAGLFAFQHIPNYWKLSYITGFEKVPNDLLNAIGKLASINIFHILGDLILGAGIASQSIGIDGLSQSISSTSSAENAGYGARIKGYLADLKSSLPKLKDKYSGHQLVSL